MIVNSPSVHLSLQDPVNANRGVILYQNLVTVDNITADSELPSDLALNLANPATYLKWESEITSEQFVTVQLSGSSLVDAVGIAEHNLGSGLTPISVQGQVSESEDWEDLTVDLI